MEREAFFYGILRERGKREVGGACIKGDTDTYLNGGHVHSTENGRVCMLLFVFY